MAPYLTTRGKAALAVALIWLVVGALLLLTNQSTAAWPLLMGSSVVLATLLVAFFVAVPLSRLLDSPLVELELEPPGGRAALRTDELVQPVLRVSNRGGLRLRRLRARPELSAALTAETDQFPDLELPAASRVEVELPLVARRSGRWFVHGFHVVARDMLGMFEVRNYLAAPLAMTFLPAGLLDRRIGRLQPANPFLHERIGVHEVRQRGFGTDLREIRDHQHGDPFRNIAWKATARTGRLMVREFESEIALNAYLVVDISATMRGGVQRGGKLEHIIRLSANFARAVLRGNDRVGVITFDERIYGHLPPREGTAQMMRVSRHLIGTTNVVDDAMTELDEDEVIEALVRYLMLQERLDFRRRTPRRHRGQGRQAVEDVYDVELLNRWLRARLATPEATDAIRELRVGVLGYDELSLARRFCHLHGVEIPYRAELRYGTKEQGLVASIETILEESRNPHTILVLSDLAGFVNVDRIVDVFRLARLKRHRLAVLAPFTPAYVPRPTGEDGGSALLHEIFGAAEARERRRVLRQLTEAAVPIVEVEPTDTIAGLLRRGRLLG